MLLRIPVREDGGDDGEPGPTSAGVAASTGTSGGGVPFAELSVAVLVAIALALLAGGLLGRRAACR